MSELQRLVDVRADGDSWIGAASGPAGKRAFGGQFAAQALAAAWRTVDADRLPTNMQLQYLRGGDAGEETTYTVTPMFDGRTASARRVDAHHGSRLLNTSTVSFALPMRGPEHGRRDPGAQDPEALPQTGPPGPAPALPLEELDIRIVDEGTGERFVRHMWWRASVPLPDDPVLHTLIAVCVCDLYMTDAPLRVHGHSMAARTHRSGTTNWSMWFHQPVRADEWNLLETMSPAASRGRGVVTGSLIRGDGVVAATHAQEGFIAEREPTAG
ncbi:acyl-CoA thioesterase [Mycolicibacterium phlei]|uniref:acyl-CoA thioesterase n=1 Tax=Mycolicibacterium phlei TaxID=1771 RepID=UPI00025ADAAC|nr:acyl-CoA thioesterase domain-containing protein [Mycolicibacterium phlei]EID18308.1 acyl-CoA thioesterase [Mycolicibacterium phlei RIVM601174]MBF4190551.1 acyl-CoA thioesterase [Mycolicibacterium phlei]